MASDRTFVTELATGLGILGDEDLDSVLRRRPSVMANLSGDDWDHLRVLRECGDFDTEFLAGFDNGRSFHLADDALRGRRPALVEWTGGRRAIGDETTPADLRVDHVYLVSCKYLSKILHNPSPARLFEGLLSTETVDDSGDWFERVAPTEYQDLYTRCLEATSGATSLFASGIDNVQRRQLAEALRDGWPPGADEAYERLCHTVSDASAARWRERIGDQHGERLLWRLLRIGAAPYFILGVSGSESVRLRVDTPWDWRQRFRLRELAITPQEGGQPRVGWSAACEDRQTGATITVDGHVEIRWSHGRFAQRPEAKVYLDTTPSAVPGYHTL